VVTGILVLFIIVLLGRARLVNQSIKEKSERLTLLTDEFDQYKRKSLEKEKKLSRELQTERNKLLELKRT
jgi:Zn-dependent M16 (insulinase) family peptidase